MVAIKVERVAGRTVEEIEWKAEELNIIERPNGPAAAAILAAGIGVLALGFLTTLAEANTDVKDWLQFQDRVGPLSGKVIVSMIAYVVSWAALSPVLWKRNVPLNIVLIVAAVLLAGGFLGTFPKFFQLFAPG